MRDNSPVDTLTGRTNALDGPDQWLLVWKRLFLRGRTAIGTQGSGITPIFRSGVQGSTIQLRDHTIEFSRALSRSRRRAGLAVRCLTTSDCNGTYPGLYYHREGRLHVINDQFIR